MRCLRDQVDSAPAAVLVPITQIVSNAETVKLTNAEVTFRTRPFLFPIFDSSFSSPELESALFSAPISEKATTTEVMGTRPAPGIEPEPSTIDLVAQTGTFYNKCREIP